MDAEDLLARIEEVSPLNRDARRTFEFMLRGCDAIAQHLPTVGVVGLGVAHRFWAGGANASELERARLDCWSFVRQGESTRSSDDPEAWAVRAVICVLDPPTEDRDIYELAQFFIGVIRRIEPQEDALIHVMKSVFADVVQRLAIDTAQNGPYRDSDRS